MGFIRKIKGSLVKVDSSLYVGEDTYLFYDIDTGCIRITDGTPGGKSACIEGIAGGVNWGTIVGDINTQTDLISLIGNYIPLSEKGAANGVATLDSGGLIPATQLPSYVDDVLEYPDLASFPTPGETGKIYIALDTGTTYRWSGTTYVALTDPNLASEISYIKTFIGKDTSGPENPIYSSTVYVTQNGSLETAIGELDAAVNTVSNSIPNTFSTITVVGQSDIIADSQNDTLTFTAGTNITITTNPANDEIIIESVGSGGASVLNDLNDVVLTTPTATEVLQFDGTNWVNVPNTSVGIQDHTQLQNIGTNTHAQIDSHIADTTIHFTEGSISHLNIQDIGTNTHAQIDSHIADTTIHFTKGSIILNDLGDVVLTTPVSGEVLQFDGTNWVNVPNTSSPTSLNDLIDVTITNPSINDLLYYDGTNWVNTPAPVFGTEFQYAENLGVTTTTSTTFLSKLLYTTTSLPAGTYRVSISYGWNHNGTNNDFEAQLLEDGLVVGEIHKQEPKDSAGTFSTTGTSQRYYTTKVYYRVLSAGTHTYDFQFRTDAAGTASSTWDVRLEIWRVE